jgi:polyisoprenoid-binding protein YceI
MNKKILGTLLGLCLLLAPAWSMASTFEVAKESNITFVAKITGSSFKGECETLTGTAELDAATQKMTGLMFSLNAEDIKTGMDQRDGHMYKKYLETKTFPVVTFKAAGVVLPAPGKSKILEGTFAIHGKEKVLKVLLIASEVGADKIAFKATWALNIGDFGIKQPKFMVVKMDKEIQMEAQMVLTRKQ